jgi:hypothetical protein
MKAWRLDRLGGKLSLKDTRRRAALVWLRARGCSLTEVCRAVRLVDREVAIGAMWNHLLTGLETKLGAIEMHRDDFRLERHHVGDAADFSVGVRIRPGRQTCLTDVVITAEPFVWAEGLEFHWSEGRPIDVGALNIPARREA